MKHIHVCMIHSIHICMKIIHTCISYVHMCMIAFHICMVKFHTCMNTCHICMHYFHVETHMCMHNTIGIEITHVYVGSIYAWMGVKSKYHNTGTGMDGRIQIHLQITFAIVK